VQRFDLSYESDDPAEIEAIAEAVRAATSRPLIIRSAGSAARHRVVIALADVPAADFLAELTAILTIAPLLIHEFDPAGHWRLVRVKEAAA
jgi:hypothetical protein